MLRWTPRSTFAQRAGAGPAACPPGLAPLPGAGAAGGLGAALLALRRPVRVGHRAGPRARSACDAALAGCDLVITGEGSFDDQSLRGKVVAGVAGAARDLGPALRGAGRPGQAGRREAAAAGVTQAYTLVDHFGSVDERARAPGRGPARTRPPAWPGSGALA